MNERLRKGLSRLAAKRERITYGEVAQFLGLDMERPPDRAAMAQVLGEISDHEHAHGRPLLSAIVVLAASGLPGAGFFELARNAGRMAADGDQLSYFARELSAVHDYWAAERKRRGAAKPG